MATSIEVLKSYFQPGAKPTAVQMEELLEAFLHRDEDMQRLLGLIAEIAEAEEGVVTDKYMTPFLTKKAIEAIVRLSSLTSLASDVQAVVDASISALVDAAPSSLDTLKEIADALGNNEDAYNTLLEAIGNRYTKAELDAFFEGAIGGKKQVSWERITDKPVSFPATAHTHTPSQVGLGNLPNAKSDEINLSSSNVLATSKAVNKIFARTYYYMIRNGVYYIGNVNSAGSSLTVIHNLGTTSYECLGSVRSSLEGTESASYNHSNLVFFNKNENDFAIRFRELDVGTQSLFIFWGIVVVDA